MNLVARMKAWRRVRRIRVHREWLRQSRVILPKPALRCQHNSVEAVL
jgi:hypothetical protein